MACQVPVFRYALERWESDNYQLFLVSPTELSSAQQTEIASFTEKAKTANLKFQQVQLNSLSEQELWKLPQIDTSVTEPTLYLFAPGDTTKPVFVAPYSNESLKAILDSSARKTIVKELIDGTSCVWLIVHRDMPERAKELQAQLDTYLAQTAEQLELPEGIIGSEQRHEINKDTDLDDVLRSSIPLKIAFSSQTLDATNAEESIFIKTLLHGLPPQIQQLEEPLVFPIFGRGRKIDPLQASDINLQNILAGSQYLCGACSCQVKEQNPGSDLLINEDWPRYLTEGLAIVDKDLPPLSGVADITSPSAPSNTAQESDKTAEPNKTSSNPLIITLAIVVFLAIASTIFILRK